MAGALRRPHRRSGTRRRVRIRGAGGARSRVLAPGRQLPRLPGRHRAARARRARLSATALRALTAADRREPVGRRTTAALSESVRRTVLDRDCPERSAAADSARPLRWRASAADRAGSRCSRCRDVDRRVANSQGEDDAKARIRVESDRGSRIDRDRLRRRGGARAGAQVEAGGVEASSAAAESTVTQFFVPPPDAAAVSQITSLVRQRDFGDAAQAGGAGGDAARGLVHQRNARARSRSRCARRWIAAALEDRVPVLVAYDIPFRDCAQYSAGGAVDTRRVRGLDRRLRAGDRQAQGGRHPRAGQPGDHPLQHDHLRRRRLVQADGHRRDRRHRPRAGRQLGRALRAAPGRDRDAGRHRARRVGLSRRHAQRLAGRRRGGVSHSQGGLRSDDAARRW